MRDNGGMSNLPGPAPDSSAPEERSDHAVTERAVTGRARVRRAPKYGTFALLGLVVGIIAAMALTFGFQRSPDEIDESKGEVYFSPLQVFGFLLLFCGLLSVALFLVIAWLVDVGARRRARTVDVGRVEVRESIDKADAAAADQPQPGAGADGASADAATPEDSPRKEDSTS